MICLREGERKKKGEGRGEEIAGLIKASMVCRAYWRVRKTGWRHLKPSASEAWMLSSLLE